MDYYEAVLSQGERLKRSAESVASALANTDLQPWRGGLLAVASMGASSHASTVFVDRLVRHGHRALKIDASELMSLGADLDAHGQLCLCFRRWSQPRDHCGRPACSSGPPPRNDQRPVGPDRRCARRILGLDHGEDSPVYTVGYTATLQAFGLLATALDGADDGDDWAALPGLLSETHSSLSDPAKDHRGRALNELSSLDFVGDRASFAAAAEAKPCSTKKPRERPTTNLHDMPQVPFTARWNR